MDSVQRLARFLPQIEGLASETGARTALCQCVLRVGPLSYRLRSNLLVQPTAPPTVVSVQLEAPDLRLMIASSLEFFTASLEETTLRYAATVRSTHPLVRRLRGSLLTMLEEHVDVAVDLAVTRGRQYVRAARELAADMPGHPPYPGRPRRRFERSRVR
jgi:hypothetical protein